MVFLEIGKGPTMKSWTLQGITCQQKEMGPPVRMAHYGSSVAPNIMLAVA